MWVLPTPDLFRMMVTEKLQLTNHLERLLGSMGCFCKPRSALSRLRWSPVSRNECGAVRDRVPLFVVFTMHSRFDPGCDGDWGLGTPQYGGAE
jgi:hypothetical protein